MYITLALRREFVLSRWKISPLPPFPPFSFHRRKEERKNGVGENFLEFGRGGGCYKVELSGTPTFWEIRLR